MRVGRLLGSLVVLAFAAASCFAVEVSPPRVLIPGWTIELVAREPELVTPVGCRWDGHGGLLVVECHTHFRPEDYPGPTEDRIYRYRDGNEDGRLDRRELFYSGGHATMGLDIAADGWVYVATRSEVVRIKDSDGDFVADQREVLITQETKADYPHNGLAALAIGPDGWIYLGQGENFGEPYRLVARDGSTQSGGGEGGNIYRFRPDGGELHRYATGFWNPFGLRHDAAGRLWTVENDPDARPPCRLLEVIPRGDYGFQFRFGRAGTHPLLAWDGELPGTLPMVAGTGEAPCAVLPVGSTLWVSSWGDNRIERFFLERGPHGWQGKQQTIVQGDVHFRPVDMSMAGDGSIYLTDWVDRSYNVHRTGRLWRVMPDPNLPRSDIQDHLPVAEIDEAPKDTLSASEGSASHFDQGDSVEGLVRQRWKELCAPADIDAAARSARLRKALQGSESNVRRVAARYAAEAGLQELSPDLEKALDRADLKAEELAELIGALSYLRAGPVPQEDRDELPVEFLSRIAANSATAPATRGMALRWIPTTSEEPTAEEIARWMEERPDREFSRQGIRLLGMRGSEAATAVLRRLATDARLPAASREDAQSFLDAIDRKSAVGRELLSGDPASWWSEVSTGGDPDAGARVFFRSSCVKCHPYQGRGADLGPELGTLHGRMTRQRIFTSLVDPGREVAPLYSTWNLTTTDGRVLTGTKLNAGGVDTNLRYLAADGSTFEIPLAEIETQTASGTSVMPANLAVEFTLDELRNLLAFLE